MITSRRKRIGFFARLDAYRLTAIVITLFSTLNRSMEKINSSPYDVFKKLSNRLRAANVPTLTILGLLISWISPTLYGLSYLFEPFSIFSPYILKGIFDFDILVKTQKRVFDANAFVPLLISTLLSIPWSLPEQIARILSIELQNETLINYIRLAPFVIVSRIIQQIVKDVRKFDTEVKQFINLDNITYYYNIVKGQILHILFSQERFLDLLLQYFNTGLRNFLMQSSTVAYYIGKFIYKSFAIMILATTGLNINNVDEVWKIIKTVRNKCL